VCFQLNYLESFTGIAGHENFSFMLDPARINGQFATDSDVNFPRVVAHCQGLRKINFKDLGLGRRVGSPWNFIIL
jgi:hypothetical protein